MTDRVRLHARQRWLAILVLLCACSPSTPPETATATPRSGPATARWELVDQMREDLRAPRHPADGGGRAWLEADPEQTAAQVGTPGRWTIMFEAGPLGIAIGGMLYLQVSPFWGWSTPQVTTPDAPGYTEVTTDAPGVVIQATTLDQQLLGIAISGHALEPGQRIRLVYGAGPAGAAADRFAERDLSLIHI